MLEAPNMLRHRSSPRTKARGLVPHVVLAALAVPLAWGGIARAQDPHPDNPPAPSNTGAPAPGPPLVPTATTTAEPPPPPPAYTAPAPPPPQPNPSAVISGVNPMGDQQDLTRQGQQRPSDANIPVRPNEVFSDEWWGKARPVFEIHGYFRTRAELFHNFALGRHNAPGDSQNLWPQPLDQSYTDQSATRHNVSLCGPYANQTCQDKSEASANMRFRMNPELHISDNLRIMSQIDLLDNVVLGSTPEAYAIQPGVSKNGSGYVTAGYNGFAPLGAFSTTQAPPTAGVNALANSVAVNRVWGEYQSPVGQIRFGRMPSNWGLGMLINSGDGLDSDYQTTTDRIMFISGIKSADLYFGGAWDFVSTGPTSATAFSIDGGQPYNTCNLCNVNEWVLFAAHRTNPELQKMQLGRGDIVVNGGVYAVYRSQVLDVVAGETPLTTNTAPPAANNGLDIRGASAFIPDLWLQTLWRKFRFEAEFATIVGSVEKTQQVTNIQNPTLIREFGLTSQLEYRAVEDKLRLQFGFGWASGDPWAQSLSPGGLQAEQNGSGPISTFRFHQDYRVDLIFFRQILTRVEGAYYLRPSVDYDFLRSPDGQKFGGGVALLWDRASEFIQTPGHKRDLGVELDAQLYYQAKDGSLNDDPEKVGGFYTMLQYGVFFPMGGLDYLVGQQSTAAFDWSTSAAQTVRLFLGVAY